MDAEMAADESEGQRRENDQGFNYTSCFDLCILKSKVQRTRYLPDNSNVVVSTLVSFTKLCNKEGQQQHVPPVS